MIGALLGCVVVGVLIGVLSGWIVGFRSGGDFVRGIRATCTHAAPRILYALCPYAATHERAQHVRWCSRCGALDAGDGAWKGPA